MVLRFGLERRFHLSGWGTVSSMSARHCYSGFCETALAGILRRRGIRHLIVTDCTTSVCVESTVRDAMFRNDPCCVLSDRTGEPIGRRDAQVPAGSVFIRAARYGSGARPFFDKHKPVSVKV